MNLDQSDFLDLCSESITEIFISFEVQYHQFQLYRCKSLPPPESVRERMLSEMVPAFKLGTEYHRHMKRDLNLLHYGYFQKCIIYIKGVKIMKFVVYIKNFKVQQIKFIETLFCRLAFQQQLIACIRSFQPIGMIRHLDTLLILVFPENMTARLTQPGWGD